MVKNISSNAEFYCLNHKEPVKMVMRERTDDSHDNFFACPKYMRKDEKHPDGFGEGETGCSNRLSLADAGDILNIFNKTVEEDLLGGTIADYNGYSFRHHGIDVKVLHYGKGNLRIGVLNKKAVKG